MKQTLYQILGVETDASAQAIEAAYRTRIEAMQADTSHDPNTLVALRQAKEILSEANQRAAYDASLANRAAPARVQAYEAPEATFFLQWGKWIGLGAVLISLGLWLSKKSPQPSAPSPIASPIASKPEVVASALEKATNTHIMPDTAAISPEEAPENPIWGKWSCYEAVSGRSSVYSFLTDGTLNITATDGQIAAVKYEVTGSLLKLEDAGQPRTLTIEEWSRKKMILNTGKEGRRLVCKR